MRSAPSEQCDNVSDRGVTGSQIKTEYALIAQSVEHAAVNRGVVGSSPTGGAKNRDVLLNVFIFFFQIEFGQWQLVQTAERLLTASWPSAAGGRCSEARMAQRSKGVAKQLQVLP